MAATFDEIGAVRLPWVSIFHSYAMYPDSLGLGAARLHQGFLKLGSTTWQSQNWRLPRLLQCQDLYVAHFLVAGDRCSRISHLANR